MKKLLLVITIVSILLMVGCNKNEITEKVDVPENTNNQQENVTNNVENDVNTDKLNDYFWFVKDSYHCDTPGGFAGAMPDMYFFSSDNTYSWIISDYTMNERVIAKKGTWKIEDNKLILHEQEETYLDGGELIEVKDDPMLGDDTVLVDYTVTNRTVDNTTEHSIEYVGISDFSKEIDVDNIRYEYKLDGKVMFSGIPESVERSVDDWLAISRLKK